MPPSAAPQYGITPPTSLDPPTEFENALNDQLIEELTRQGSFESTQESQQRAKVLETLQSLTERFVQKVGHYLNEPEESLKTAGGKIFTFGSYRMGVHGPGSDIDTLVVGPEFVSRYEFFLFYPQLLRELPDIESITAIPEAFVPVLKVKIAGISIDLIFAGLKVTEVPLDFSLSDESLLLNLDDKDLRAVNGTRVTDEILCLVPNPKVFKLALRAVKLWAQKRAIYGNIMGFPGGVAWAMLVARVCQMYPNANSATIVCRFYEVFASWNWPTPVLLKPLQSDLSYLRVWNPKLYTQDRLHRMPVITPAYPPMCSTHNITSSTQNIIMLELEKGRNIVKAISEGSQTWSDFFAEPTFFAQYRKYLSIKAATKGSAEEHLQWAGLVQSKVRLLVQKLEVLSAIKSVHPYVKTFDKSFLCDEKDASRLVESLPVENIEITKDTDLSNFSGKVSVHTTVMFIGLELEPNGM